MTLWDLIVKTESNVTHLDSVMDYCICQQAKCWASRVSPDASLSFGERSLETCLLSLQLFYPYVG